MFHLAMTSDDDCMLWYLITDKTRTVYDWLMFVVETLILGHIDRSQEVDSLQ